MNRPAMPGAIGATALSSVFAAAVLAAPAVAQEAGAASTSSTAGAAQQLEEVVVTAEKRSELLSKAPLAISTVNQHTMDELGITSAQQLVTTVPNFQISANGYTPQLSIRGIGNFSGSYSTVAVQVDGIYEPNTAVLTNGLYDVGRIEVARGPQGTVYGRNATAGVLNINTADPVREFLAFGDIAYGNYSDFTARGVINIPLGNHVQVRGSVVRESNDGYYAHGAAARDYAKTDILTAQLTTLVRLTDSLTWRVALEHSDNTGTINYLQGVNYLYYPNANLGAGSLGAPVIVAARPDLMAQERVSDNSLDTWEDALRSRLTWAINDQLTATYLAGYSAFIDNGIDTATGAFSARQKGTDTRSSTQELDLNFDTSRLKAVAGLYYYRDYNHGDASLHIGNTVPYPLSTLVPGAINQPAGNEPSAYGLIDILQHTAFNYNISKAAFSQATYGITDTLRLTGGVRYTKDTHGVDSSSQVCAFGTGAIPNANLTCGVPFGPPSSTAQTTESHNTSWKASLDYDLTPDQLLYGTVATGYRGGGVSGNTRLPPQFLTYAPETVTNYELGWKSLLLERSLALSLDIFNMEYKNMQVSAIEHDLTGNPTPVTINAAKARIKGAEFELDWRLTAADEIHGYATYLDARYTSFPNGVNASVNPDGIYNSTVSRLDAAGADYALLPTNLPANFSGNHLPNAPQETLRVAYSHTFLLGAAGTLIPSAQLYWQAKSYADLANSAQATRKDYTRSDLNLTYKSGSDRLTVDAYIHNVENHTVWQSANAKWDETMAFYMPPRTFGVRVGYRFDY
jgi:iron complex outermembrane recepter protein